MSGFLIRVNVVVTVPMSRLPEKGIWELAYSICSKGIFCMEMKR